ncbi:MAG: nucleotide exchange factor GrpE [Deltaproteobacteria bacterium]|nr:nucleotide exchange factor GrpE [Deltaproteobacteria bacterium]
MTEAKSKVDALREALAKRRAAEASAPEAASGDEEVTPTETASGESANGAGATSDELLTRVQTAETQASAARDQYLRTLAEFENVRKRLERERDDAIAFANERLLREVMPVLDHLNEALGTVVASAADAAAPSGLPAFVEGVELTQRQFLSILNRFGFEEIPTIVGAKFDPTMHEAVAQVDAEGAASGTIVVCHRRGYRLNGRLLRAALVVVAR